ncbi:unnamed protein product [Chrysodeixis includens]|uniref:GILT-like protein 1 n=1 Tax=Chrysodeixis includens TaxID=689277 RepID=A0A9P0FSX8_CHRIL|nr:unnamed protein product [Chrysodeixis includens]
MATKQFVIITACFLLGLTQVNGVQLVNGKVKITVGTASGCLDTVSLFQTQLIETYDAYKDFLELDFVPWGRTVWHADGSFTCQFHEPDCWANRLHRCALDMLKDNQDAQMHFMSCEFTLPRPGFTQTSYACAQAVGLNLIEVDHCVNNNGDNLDRAAQLAAQVPMSTINFVPYIVFNDIISVDNHIQARNRLKSMVCFALASDPSTNVSGCEIE